MNSPINAKRKLNPISAMSFSMYSSSSLPKDAPSLEKVKDKACKTGSLKKLSGKGFLSKTWRERLCVLVRNKLYFYEIETSNGTGKCCGSVNLEHFDTCGEACTRITKKAANVFVIGNSEKHLFDPLQARHFFAAESVTEMKEWINAISSAMNKARKNSQTEQSSGLKNNSEKDDSEMRLPLNENRQLDHVTKRRVKGPPGRRLPKKSHNNSSQAGTENPQFSSENHKNGHKSKELGRHGSFSTSEHEEDEEPSSHSLSTSNGAYEKNPTLADHHGCHLKKGRKQGAGILKKVDGKRNDTSSSDDEGMLNARTCHDSQLATSCSMEARRLSGVNDAHIKRGVELQNLQGGFLPEASPSRVHRKPRSYINLCDLRYSDRLNIVDIDRHSDELEQNSSGSSMNTLTPDWNGTKGSKCDQNQISRTPERGLEFSSLKRLSRGKSLDKMICDKSISFSSAGIRSNCSGNTSPMLNGHMARASESQQREIQGTGSSINVEGKMANINQSIRLMRKQLDSISGDAQRLDEDMGGLRHEATSFQEHLVSLRDNMDSNREKMESLHTQVVEVECQLTALIKDVNNMKDYAKDLLDGAKLAKDTHDSYMLEAENLLVFLKNSVGCCSRPQHNCCNGCGNHRALVNSTTKPNSSMVTKRRTSMPHRYNDMTLESEMHGSKETNGFSGNCGRRARDQYKGAEVKNNNETAGRAGETNKHGGTGAMITQETDL